MYKRQHEYRADKWAIENLIPKSELIKAIKKNLDSIYQMCIRDRLHIEAVPHIHGGNAKDMSYHHH